jgi:endoglucanase
MDAILQKLIACHSTPGDEGEVREALSAGWRASGWTVQTHGAYAVTARDECGEPGRPVLLICAHMDSPGYAVDRLTLPAGRTPGTVRLGVTELGSPDFAGPSAPAVLKTRRGRFGGLLRAGAVNEDGERDIVFELGGDAAAQAETRHGDRACFAPKVTREGSLLEGPFLDNRLGCWMLLRLADAARAWRTRYEIVLGATASEELCGFGARVLAAQVRPDSVIVLDTTYESETQGVRLGGGPVLTLSDTSVLLGPDVRDRVTELMAAAGVPLQTEVYNFSGTDARAFPQLGLTCPVLPLLVPTRGNHGPVETADARDVEAWQAAIQVLAEGF